MSHMLSNGVFVSVINVLPWINIEYDEIPKKIPSCHGIISYSVVGRSTAFSMKGNCYINVSCLVLDAIRVRIQYVESSFHFACAWFIV